MTQPDIGSKLRTLRQKYNLSQRQLAQRAGVTNGQISMIEQNKISPSVSSLKKILDGFPTSLSDFFASDVSEGPKTFYRKDELIEIGTRAIHGPDATEAKLSLLRVGRPGENNLMMLKETYQPGADTGKRLYSHDAEEAGIIISGQIEITVEDESAVLGPGDAYVFDSKRPHRFRNKGPDICILISACTPPTF